MESPRAAGYTRRGTRFALTQPGDQGQDQTVMPRPPAPRRPVTQPSQSPRQQQMPPPPPPGDAAASQPAAAPGVITGQHQVGPPGVPSQLPHPFVAPPSPGSVAPQPALDTPQQLRSFLDMEAHRVIGRGESHPRVPERVYGAYYDYHVQVSGDRQARYLAAGATVAWLIDHRLEWAYDVDGWEQFAASLQPRRAPAPSGPSSYAGGSQTAWYDGRATSSQPLDRFQAAPAWQAPRPPPGQVQGPPPMLPQQHQEPLFPQRSTAYGGSLAMPPLPPAAQQFTQAAPAQGVLPQAPYFPATIPAAQYHPAYAMPPPYGPPQPRWPPTGAHPAPPVVPPPPARDSQALSLRGMPTYDGKACVDVFLQRWARWAEFVGLDSQPDSRQASALLLALDSSAYTTVQRAHPDLGALDSTTLRTCVRTVFNNRQEEYRNKLFAFRRGGNRLFWYIEEFKRLQEMASYPEHVALRLFIQGVDSVTLRQQLLTARPTTVQDAIDVAVSLESSALPRDRAGTDRGPWVPRREGERTGGADGRGATTGDRPRGDRSGERGGDRSRPWDNRPPYDDRTRPGHRSAAPPPRRFTLQELQDQLQALQMAAASQDDDGTPVEQAEPLQETDSDDGAACF